MNLSQVTGNKTFFRVFHLSLALVSLYSIFRGYSASSVSLVQYLSFFTILSGLLLSGVYFALSFGIKRTKTIELFRGAIVVYMIITAIAFAVLLRDQPVADHLADFLGHKFVPIAAVVEWLIYPPLFKLTNNIMFKWYIFPFIYFFYIQIYGVVTGWYPYYFFDAGQGFTTVLLYALALSVAFFAISFAVIFVGNKLRRLESKQ